MSWEPGFCFGSDCGYGSYSGGSDCGFRRWICRVWFEIEEEVEIVGARAVVAGEAAVAAFHGVLG